MNPRATAWAVLAGAVLIGAAGQGLTAAPGLGRMPTALFAVVLAASAVLLIVQLASATWAIHRLVTRERATLRPLAVWSAVAVVAGFVALALLPPLALLVAAAALCVLPAAASGRRPLSGFRVFRRTPGRAVLGVVVLVLLAALGIVVAVAAGLFVTGAAGGMLMWLWFGLVGAAELWWFTRLQAHS